MVEMLRAAMLTGDVTSCFASWSMMIKTLLMMVYKKYTSLQHNEMRRSSEEKISNKLYRQISGGSFRTKMFNDSGSPQQKMKKEVMNTTLKWQGNWESIQNYQL